MQAKKASTKMTESQKIALKVLKLRWVDMAKMKTCELGNCSSCALHIESDLYTGCVANVVSQMDSVINKNSKVSYNTMVGCK
jgi:hypothetical protein